MTTLLLGYNNLQSYRDCYSWAAHQCQVEGRELTLPNSPRQTAPSRRMSRLVMYPADRKHINQDGDLCVFQPLDISWIRTESKVWRPLKAESEITQKQLRTHPFLLMRLEGFSKIVLDASIRICTRADLMKHRKRTGQRGTKKCVSSCSWGLYPTARVQDIIHARCCR